VNLIGLAWHWFVQATQWHGTDGIPNRLLEHLGYSGLALGLAALLALPAGLLIGHTGRGGFLVVNSANAARSLPTLGLVILLAITVSIGVTPVIVALVALAIPPILVNTYEGVRQVDRELTWSARGMGMTSLQVLLRVELPSALPLVLLGLRTAAIQTVSTATVAAYVGLGGLGRYIIDGLARRGFVVLDDPKNLFGAQNVTPLVNRAAQNDTVKAALNAVSAKLDTPTLAGLVKKVVADKQDADKVAADWLKSAGLA
jgi:osmoprotectant transport system permease protein